MGDNGTSSALYGIGVSYGHSSNVPTASPTTTNAYGLSISSYYDSGRIQNMYDLYLAAGVGSGTVDNHWGLYQADTSKNYLGGNLGIGTTNPNDGKLEVKGGTVCVDTNSDDSATSCIANESDERLKTNIAAMSASSSLETILALRPVSFDWRASDPEVLTHWPALARYASSTRSIGLIAQEVIPVLPEALSLETVGDSEVQYFQLDYTKFVPLIISALKELYAKISDLAATVASFADHFTTKELTFTRAAGDELDVKRLKAGETICLGATCITESQLAAILVAAGQSAIPSGQGSAGTPAASSSTAPATDPMLSTSSAQGSPPQVIIAGNNPAHINVGDAYQDLGATAKDSEGHDLGVKTFLNGLLVSDIVLDTSTTTTDAIDYVATDTWGNTATATRSVIIEPPAPPLTNSDHVPALVADAPPLAPDTATSVSAPAASAAEIQPAPSASAIEPAAAPSDAAQVIE